MSIEWQNDIHKIYLFIDILFKQRNRQPPNRRRQQLPRQNEWFEEPLDLPEPVDLQEREPVDLPFPEQELLPELPVEPLIRNGPQPSTSGQQNNAGGRPDYRNNYGIGSFIDLDKVITTF